MRVTNTIKKETEQTLNDVTFVKSVLQRIENILVYDKYKLFDLKKNNRLDITKSKLDSKIIKQVELLSQSKNEINIMTNKENELSHDNDALISSLTKQLNIT